MSTAPERLAVHLPEHWTAQQAMAVHDAIDALSTALWRQYEHALLAQFDSDAPDPAAPTQPNLFDDDLSF